VIPLGRIDDPVAIHSRDGKHRACPTVFDDSFLLRTDAHFCRIVPSVKNADAVEQNAAEPTVRAIRSGNQGSLVRAIFRS